MIHYRYTHTRTEGTTGYFSCEPDPPPSLAEALALLVERPLDEFLRRHLLNRLTAMPADRAAGQFAEAIPEHFGGELPPPLRALIRELILTAPSWAGGEPFFAVAEEAEPDAEQDDDAGAKPDGNTNAGAKPNTETVAAIPAGKGNEADADGDSEHADAEPSSTLSAVLDLDAATPLIPLRWMRLPDRDLHTRWGARLADNIQHHRACPAPADMDLPPLYPHLREILQAGAEQVERAGGLAANIGQSAAAATHSPFPGRSLAFTAPFPAHIREVYAEHAAKLTAGQTDGQTDGQPAGAAPHVRPPAARTADLAEERLAAAGIIAGAQMRHTASLSPVALLRPWNIRAGVNRGRHRHSLEGQATTYGRGLSLPDARASCLMEMVERASAYLSVSEAGIDNLAHPAPVVYGRRSAVLAEHGPAIDPNDYPLEVPYADAPLLWMAGRTACSAAGQFTGQAAGLAAGPTAGLAACSAAGSAAGSAAAQPAGETGLVYVPVQMVSLFCNLDEIALFAAPGSTGIATGCTMEEARLAALTEILERDAEATTPFAKSGCFTLSADSDPALAALLADYAARGINVQFQDLTGPTGLPVYKCFVMSPRGAIARGHGAGLSARRAIVSALTETPFPYPDGGASGPLLRKLPVRNLSELPDYTLPTPAASLAMLEDLLRRNMRPPVYVDLTRPDLGFPVTRAFVPGLELAADTDAFSRVPLRLYANYLGMWEMGK